MIKEFYIDCMGVIRTIYSPSKIELKKKSEKKILLQIAKNFRNAVRVSQQKSKFKLI